MRQYMTVYEGEDMNTLIEPDMGEGESKLIWVVHDETCFSAHDAPSHIWIEKDSMFVHCWNEAR
jgi:hypothetical protein